jgi:hypothetical protein
MRMVAWVTSLLAGDVAQTRADGEAAARGLFSALVAAALRSIALTAIPLIWLERNGSRLQDRLGPNRGPFGILQSRRHDQDLP